MQPKFFHCRNTNENLAVFRGCNFCGAGRNKFDAQKRQRSVLSKTNLARLPPRSDPTPTPRSCRRGSSPGFQNSRPLRKSLLLLRRRLNIHSRQSTETRSAPAAVRALPLQSLVFLAPAASQPQTGKREHLPARSAPSNVLPPALSPAPRTHLDRGLARAHLPIPRS